MPELAYAEETLTVVQSILGVGLRTRWIYRMILSRIYYAAHHLGRLLLRNLGLAPHHWRRNVHYRVINELRHRYVLSGAMSPDALDALCQLRQYRTNADYDLTVAIPNQQIINAINYFTTYFDECRRILGVI